MAEPPAKSTDQLAREKRLAEALRQNLRRRKAQARARADTQAADKPPAKSPKS
jgi:hypothetical protein